MTRRITTNETCRELQREPKRLAAIWLVEPARLGFYSPAAEWPSRPMAQVWNGLTLGGRGAVVLSNIFDRSSRRNVLRGTYRLSPKAKTNRSSIGTAAHIPCTILIRSWRFILQEPPLHPPPQLHAKLSISPRHPQVRLRGAPSGAQGAITPHAFPAYGRRIVTNVLPRGLKFGTSVPFVRIARPQRASRNVHSRFYARKNFPGGACEWSSRRRVTTRPTLFVHVRFSL